MLRAGCSVAERAVPESLCEEIRSGNCVAFVGAGFSAAAVPRWFDLLERLARRHESADVRKRVLRIIKQTRPTSNDFEAAAQLLRDGREEAFLDDLHEEVAHPKLGPRMKERIARLKAIPFSAILTTNFDGLLSGSLPGRAAYLTVLRPRAHRWWDERFWKKGRPGASVVKLHGDILARGASGAEKAPRIVFSRRDYRERLYASPAYATFLRAVLATRTVLYLGFSFTDAYLNEIRSEILQLIEHTGGDAPIAYAVVNDVDEAGVEYFRKHEGIELLTYDSKGGEDFSGFDDYLEGLHDATNPAHLLGSVLGGKRVLWLDARPWHNDAGRAFLEEAALSATSHPCRIEPVTSWSRAIECVEAAGNDPYHLVLTHWGHGGATTRAGAKCSTAERFLAEVRARDLRVPAIVFASGDHAAQNRPVALALGAFGFTWRWDVLFQEIARLFEPVA
jgi:hypothetical protein